MESETAGSGFGLPKCKTCKSASCSGPFLDCVYNPDGYFNGACTNCQSKSTAKDCTAKSTLLYTTVRLCTNLFIDMKSVAGKIKEVVTLDDEDEDDEEQSDRDSPPAKSTKPNAKRIKTEHSSSRRLHSSVKQSPGRPAAYSSDQRQSAPAKKGWLALASDETLQQLIRDIHMELGKRYTRKSDGEFSMDMVEDNDF